jgi:predicted HTH domain antitoxin
MYLGKGVEIGDVEIQYRRPQHEDPAAAGLAALALADQANDAGVGAERAPRKSRFELGGDHAAIMRSLASRHRSGAPGRSFMTTITIELPDDVFSTLRRSPREVEKEVRLAAAIDWYRRGVISQGRAAEIASIPRADFIDALAAREIEVVQIDFDALDRDLARG